MKKVCFFGSYSDSDFNNLLLKMLKDNFQITECKEEIHSFSSFIVAYLKLFFRHFKLDYDIMIIPWRGIITLPLARLLSRKPIIYFPFLSIYQTLVDDRKLYKQKSLSAKFFHFVDGFACKLSNLVIFDTNEDMKYFINEFKINPKKCRKLFLSLDETIFKPLPIKKRSEIFEVLFIGTFIPLHGIDVIVEAARKLLPRNDIKFILVGRGQTLSDIKEKIQKYNLVNIELKDPMKITDLPIILSSADICLGIFNNGKKAMSIVPHKILISLGSQKPLITANSPAVKEISLENKVNCILVNPNDPDDLSNAIILLKEDPALSQTISINGYNHFKNNLSMSKIGKSLLNYIMETIQK